MKNIENLDEQDRLIISKVIDNVEADLLCQLDFGELKRQLAEFKVKVSVMTQIAELQFKDDKATDYIKSKVIEYTELITQQEKELEKIDALKAAMHKSMWCMVGVTLQVTQP